MPPRDVRRLAHHAGLPRGLSRLLVLLVMPMLCIPGASMGATDAGPTPVEFRPGTRDADQGLPGRWERELHRRRRLLKRHPGRDPGAALALLGLLYELQGEIPHERLLKFVDSVAADRHRAPLVRSLASYQAARLLESSGAVEAAMERYERQGHLLNWQFVGPFDNTGRSGHQTPYGPETTPFSRDQSFTGKLAGEPLTWRAYDYSGLPRGAYVSLDEFLRPNTEAVAYATTWVRVPKPTVAGIHLGTGGAYKLWVNGEPSGAGEQYRAPDPLQDAHLVELRAGWNRILLKVGVMEGMWGFYARLSRRDGGPLPELEVSADPQTVDEASEESQATGPRANPRSLRRAFERAHAKSPGRGDELLAFYRWVHPFGPEDHTAIDLAREVDEHLATARTAWLRALIDPDPNVSRRSLEQAAERARRERSPLLAPVLLELAWRSASLGLEHRSRELLDEAYEAAPDDAVVELMLLKRLEHDGFSWWALDGLRDLAERYPNSTHIRRELAQGLLERDLAEQALSTLQPVADGSPTDRGVVAKRVSLLLRLGRGTRATKAARGFAQAVPALPAAHAEVSRLLAAQGDLQGASAALGKAIVLSPQDAQLHTKMARLRLRAGDVDGAVAGLSRSLELKPQQPQVRDLLASLDAARRKNSLFTRYGVDLREVAKHDTPASWKGKGAGVLHRRVAVRVLHNGLTERLDHRIIRILDDRGTRSQAVQSITYDPAESMVEVRRARVHRGDGTIESIGETRVLALAQAGFRMYYDQRQKQIRFSGLEPGDTLEVAFVKRDVAARNMFDEYFGDLLPLQGAQPSRFVQYVLEAPADTKLHFNVPIERELASGGDTAVYRYTARDVKAIKPEDKMPGWAEVAEHLHVSTYGSWDAVGEWYWGLVRDQLVIDQDIRKGIEQALAELPSNAGVRAKVHAIYRHVVRNTRYVGLEFGIHGYKPYRTTDVYARRFGDCKDKASLLKVMLEEIGIETHLVLLRTRDRGTIRTGPASLAMFNHAIVYVPELDLYLDGTAEWTGPGELPPLDQGATVLVIADGGQTDFRVTPYSRPSDNVRSSTQRVVLEPDGAARVEQTLELTGSESGQLRHLFHARDQRTERMAEIWGSIYPGVEIESVEAPDIDDILVPPTIQAELRIPSYARRERDSLRFQALGRPSTLVQNLAAQARRSHDLVLGVPSMERERIVYQLPPGMAFSQVPEDKDIETPFGRFRLEVDEQGGKATVSSMLELPRTRIEPAEYGDFRGFLQQVDASLEQTFAIEEAR